MRICLSCSTKIEDDGWTCPSCGWQPAEHQGFCFFAEAISRTNEGYDPQWYAELARLEDRHFWFEARNRLICWLTARHASAGARYLEIGCGTGFVLRGLQQRFPEWTVQATEVHADGLLFARERVGRDVVLSQMDARAIPFRGELDVIGAFDVIEHIEDDERVLREVHAALRPGGLFVCSVPQHMFLWSRFDELGYHCRRYAWKELRRKLENAGFLVVEATSFNAVLLPLMLLARVGTRRENPGDDALEELRVSSALNAMLSWALWFEFVLIRLGVRWPVGGSRIVLARKART